jgi:hypothetical protein
VGPSLWGTGLEPDPLRLLPPQVRVGLLSGRASSQRSGWFTCLTLGSATLPYHRRSLIVDHMCSANGSPSTCSPVRSLV